VEAQASSTSPSSSASPPFHEPRILCRPSRHQNTDETSNTFRFAFLAEGAANAVFRVVPYSPRGGKECFVFEDDKGNIMQEERLVQKVLRMSKGKPKTLKYKEIMEGFETEVMPLFRKTEPSQGKTQGPSSVPNLAINESFEEFVMEHQGVAIAPEAIEALIAELHTHCPDNRHIEPHHLEERGILLPDMSSVPGSVTTIEIKPKWLLQSPNAPRGAYLCRTCALHASRKSRKAYKGPWICPLALVAGNTAAIEPYVRHRSCETLAEEAVRGVHRKSACLALLHYRTRWSGYPRHHKLIVDRSRNCKISIRERNRVRGLCPPKKDSTSPTSLEMDANTLLERPFQPVAELDAILKRAVPYLTTGPGHKILQHIRYLQSQLDQEGVIRHASSVQEPQDDRLRLAMTLRDCSLFIRIPWADQNAPIEAKLGDLDFKSHGKMGDWVLKEEGLLHGGWYVDMNSGMDECWIAQGWKRYAPHYF
jgi:hypothetical protein